MVNPTRKMIDPFFHYQVGKNAQLIPNSYIMANIYLQFVMLLLNGLLMQAGHVFKVINNTFETNLILFISVCRPYVDYVQNQHIKK